MYTAKACNLNFPIFFLLISKDLGGFKGGEGGVPHDSDVNHMVTYCLANLPACHASIGHLFFGLNNGKGGLKHHRIIQEVCTNYK